MREFKNKMLRHLIYDDDSPNDGPEYEILFFLHQNTVSDLDQIFNHVQQFTGRSSAEVFSRLYELTNMGMVQKRQTGIVPKDESGYKLTPEGEFLLNQEMGVLKSEINDSENVVVDGDMWDGDVALKNETDGNLTGDNKIIVSECSELILRCYNILGVINYHLNESITQFMLLDRDGVLIDNNQDAVSECNRLMRQCHNVLGTMNYHLNESYEQHILVVARFDRLRRLLSKVGVGEYPLADTENLDEGEGINIKITEGFGSKSDRLQNRHGKWQ